MKKTIFIFIVFIIVSAAADTFIIEDGICQWEPDVRLTTGTAPSYISSNCVAAYNNVVHVVWYDNRDGNEEIYYKQSTNNGVNWGSGTRLTNNSANSRYPSIASSVLNIHIVWEDDRDGNTEIYYKRSTNGGINWGTDVRLTNKTQYSYSPSIAVSGLNVHTVWEDDRDGNREIYYKRSTNGGTNWESDVRLTTQVSTSAHASISVTGSIIHIVWHDNRDGNYEIYYKQSTNNGLNWTAGTRLTNNSASSIRPSITAFGSYVHVVWEDDRDGNDEIYYKRSPDGGLNWGAETRLTTQSDVSGYPSISVSGSNVHIVWQDERDGNREIYYKQSTNSGINWIAGMRLTNNSAFSEYPSIAISGTIVHVTWQDNRDGGYCIYYKRNPTGNVGIKNISSEVPEEFALEQNYPNPFNAVTSIKFKVASVGQFSGGQSSQTVTINVFDMLGREVATLVNEKLQPGTYEVRFDAGNLPSGIYFYQLKANNFIETKKLILLK